MALLGLQDQEKPDKDARPTRATNYARTSRPNIGQPDPLDPLGPPGPRFYKSTTVATMVGGPKDFGGTKELEDLKAGRIQELGGPK